MAKSNEIHSVSVLIKKCGTIHKDPSTRPSYCSTKSRVISITNHGADGKFDGNGQRDQPNSRWNGTSRNRHQTSHEPGETSTVSIVRVVGHYRDMLEGADNTAIYYLNSMAAPMLRNLQRDLQSLQQQMVIYTRAVNPDSGLEYHTIQANAVQAITVPPGMG